MAYVYGLRDKTDNFYFYIGSTKHAIAHRIQQHKDIIRLGRNKNRHFTHKVKLVGWENISVDILIECGADERFEIERVWIVTLLGLGHPLTNIVHDTEYPKKAAMDNSLSTFLFAASLYFNQHSENPTPMSIEIAMAWIEIINDPVKFWHIIND